MFNKFNTYRSTTKTKIGRKMETIVEHIKRDLAQYYPDVKFDVELENSFSGSSVVIYYNEPEPLASDVYNILDKYQAGHYDLMKGEYIFNHVDAEIPQVKYIMVEHV